MKKEGFNNLEIEVVNDIGKYILSEGIDYEIIKFPDNSLKFKFLNWLVTANSFTIKISLTSNDDLILLSLIKSVLDRNKIEKASLFIKYMMYQQDDREFHRSESFGLKTICNFINSMNWYKVTIFHPHSDKVEFINNLDIYDNEYFIKDTIKHIKQLEKDDIHWVIPDSGAYKTQMKLIEKLQYQNFLVCSKTRDFNTGDIKTEVPSKDLKGNSCFIVDDICLGGKTFIEIAKKLKENNCGKLYLIVSHGVFNNGIEHLLEYFDLIYTTDSICNIKHNNLKIYNI